MDLKKDLFTVTRKGQAPTVDEMIAAVKKSGFGAVEAKKEAPVKKKPGEAKGEMPELVSKALEQAKRENKFVLVDFYANWCGPCLKMLKETFPNPEVQKEMKGYVFVKVDTDKHPQISRWFGVAGIPDIRILDSNGTELKQVVGFKAASNFSKTLRTLKNNQ